jgi:hypothetical protein
MSIVRGVTGKTILSRAFVHAIHMAGGTGNIRMQSGERESCLAVIEGRVLPHSRGMAGGAVRTELAIMSIVHGVTGKTILWRAFEDIILMTRRTLDICMAARECKCGLVVVEGRVLPTGCGMTDAAFGSKLAVMCVLRSMTGKAVYRRTFINAIHMAGSTGNGSMQIGQWECSLVVIEARILPGRSAMTGRTVRPKLTIMCIPGCMT